MEGESVIQEIFFRAGLALRRPCADPRVNGQSTDDGDFIPSDACKYACLARPFGCFSILSLFSRSEQFHVRVLITALHGSGHPIRPKEIGQCKPRSSSDAGHQAHRSRRASRQPPLLAERNRIGSRRSRYPCSQGSPA